MRELVERFKYIDPKLARKLLDSISRMEYSKNGIDRKAYLFDEYVLLTTNRLKLRNMGFLDEDLLYFEKIIDTLQELNISGVSVVPILGYCYDPMSANGDGFIIESRAEGEELYDDAILSRFQRWAQKDLDNVYLKSDVTDEESVSYLLERTKIIAQVPQVHFDKFVSDMIQILEKDILIDFNGQSNFFYDSKTGFQFIDLDSHNDFVYGLTKEKIDIEKIVSFGVFVPCHYAENSQIRSSVALDSKALSWVSEKELQVLKQYNLLIFEKCIEALKNNAISKSVIEDVMNRLRVYGQ